MATLSEPFILKIKLWKDLCSTVKMDCPSINNQEPRNKEIHEQIIL